MTAFTFKRARIVRSSWLEEGGRRLDCNPYMSGALEARDKLRRLSARKDKLISLTHGHAGGIYNGPMFKRNYVESPKFGVPFLSSGTMLLADLGTLPLLRRRDAESSRLSYLKLTRGTTLISCSGTIGRMCYVRPDMEGFWSSQDVLKVVPDPSRITSGYLHAFLTSTYGVSLVVAGTYGAIIQHIEPEHIASLGVPRFSTSLETGIHEKVERAGVLRDSAARTLSQVAHEFEQLYPEVGLGDSPKMEISVLRSTEIQKRLDANFHNPLAVKLRRVLVQAPHSTIADWCDQVFLPGIFKRIHVDGPEFAAPYYTGYSLYWNEPERKGYLSQATKLFDQVSLEEGMILIQAFGQEGGLTGRPVWVGKHLSQSTTTHMLVRLVVRDRLKAAYLYGFLNSLLAYRQIACLPYGGSIPHFDVPSISGVLIPRMSNEKELKVSTAVLDAVAARDEALRLERDARQDVERLIAGDT